MGSAGLELKHNYKKKYLIYSESEKYLIYSESRVKGEPKSPFC